MKTKIKDDPAIEQIREVRHQISAEFGHDPRKVLAYYAEFEAQLLRERNADDNRKQRARTRKSA
jgi:hypothetical protein